VADENYFDADEEDALHDAWCMIHSDETEYDTFREVILGETIFEEHALDYWAENIENNMEE